MVDVLGDIVEILVGGISTLAGGIGQGLSTLAKEVFVTGSGTDSDPYKLSVFGGVLAIFAGLSLCISLSRYVTGIIASFGARK